MNLIEQCQQSCQQQPLKVVFPDALDARVLRAAEALVKQGWAKPILIGNPYKIREIALREGIAMPCVNIVDPNNSGAFERYCAAYKQRHEKKNYSDQECVETILNPLCFAASMLAAGDVDVCIAGNLSTTGDVIRAALRCVGLSPEAKTVSSFFIMVSPDGESVKAFSDAGVVPLPNETQLADITIDTAANFQRITGQEPKVAMLSFSTHGSAKHPMVQKVRDAYTEVVARAPDLIVDGELQFDAAVDPAVAAKKAPNGALKGDANVLIFPSLNAGNIGYKIAQRLGGYDALGPMLQGLNKPVHDLSRGCSADDIVDITLLASRMSMTD